MDFDGKRIMVVTPHPDDEAIGCGGLIARALDKGATVRIVCMVLGRSRQLVTGSTNEVERQKEIDAFKEKSGVEDYRVKIVGEEWLRLDHEPQRRLVDLIEDEIAEFKPDIVCIPNGESYDQDHRPVFTACITAMRPIPRKIRHFVPVVLEYEEPYTWNLGGAFKPNFYVDITGYFDKKIELLYHHKTQTRDDPFPRSKENLARLAGLRGSEVGIDKAEAFRLHRMVFE